VNIKFKVEIGDVGGCEEVKQDNEEEDVEASEGVGE